MQARIYVGTYAKYNNGSLYGKWLDLSDYSDIDEFYEACAELHSDEPDPEYMFQDWEGLPDELIGESFIDADAWEYFEACEEHGEALEAYISCFGWGSSVSDTVSSFNDRYVGEYDSEIEFAEQYVDETMEIPESIIHYFDYEAFARDLFMDYSFENGYVFAP